MTPTARNLLSTLERIGGYVSPQELTYQTGLSQSKVLSCFEELRSEGAIKVTATLTDKGRKELAK